jgi:hypothetical protein
MIRIGKLKIEGRGSYPRSRADLKADLREFARDLGLKLDFVVRRQSTVSWCRVSTANAIVCEGVGNTLFPMQEVMFFGLHEISHWIQFNEGMFRSYFGRYYYDAWQLPSRNAQRRVALRAERHADFLARKLARELFGAHLIGGGIYSGSNKKAKDFLSGRHGF